MINRMHYTLRTTSMRGTFINAVSTYDVYYDAAVGISYEVLLQAPEKTMEGLAHLPTEVQEAIALGNEEAFEATILPQQLITWWNAKIVNYVGMLRLEYDIRKKIYYQTRQTIKVESALYNLQEDVRKFMSTNPTPVEPLVIGGMSFPGYKLYTLTIWIDPQTMLPIRRVNLDRGFTIVDDFTYHSLNQPLPERVFQLPKPADAIADFDLYPEAPTLPRFADTPEPGDAQYGIYVETLIDEIKRHIILNQWEYGPFATIDLPWLTEMTVNIYRRRTENVFPPIVVVVEAPRYPTTYFLISYDFLGYVVAGFTQDPYDLTGYELLPIEASMMLRDFVPLYAGPSFEKDFVVENFLTSVKANDFFINAFRMGGKTFDMVIKNFSFHENEGYFLLNVYGKEYWDNANIEAMFNFVITGNLVDAHTTPIIVYALNVLKRLGIYRLVLMPEYEEIPAGEVPPVASGTGPIETIPVVPPTVTPAPPTAVPPLYPPPMGQIPPGGASPRH